MAEERSSASPAGDGARLGGLGEERLLDQAVSGDERAANRLFEMVYSELHGRAAGQRRRWHGDLTMNTTALVNEAYLKLADLTGSSVNGKAHFLAMASKAMRQVLLDYARQGKAAKRGGDSPLVTLNTQSAPAFALNEDLAFRLIDLDSALSKLEALRPDLARIVECRFFSGMTVEETAIALDISTPTVKRRWALARGWLFDHMQPEPHA